MTTTAHEDQFTAPLAPTMDRLAEWARWAERKRFELDCIMLRETETEVIAVWLDKHGYREIAARIRAGEHLA